MAQRDEKLGIKMTPAQVVHERILYLRSLERILEDTDFEELFENASDEDKKKIMKMAEDGDKDGILKWTKSSVEYTLEQMNIRKLRVLGRRYGIRRYNSIPKASLLSELHALVK
jgi:hypothetical protein